MPARAVDELSKGRGLSLRRRAATQLLGVAPPPPPAPVPSNEGSTLLDEDIHDGQENCLDQAGDWLEAYRSEGGDLSRTELVFLDQPSDPTGHVLVRDGLGADAPVIDPTTGERFENVDAYLATHGEYANPRAANGADVMEVLDTPVAERTGAAAIAAGIPPALVGMRVADVHSTISRVDRAIDEVDAARGALTLLDEQLAADLAALGPNLSPAQQQQYVAQFKSSTDYLAAQARLDTAATELSSSLSAARTDLDLALSGQAPPDTMMWMPYDQARATELVMQGYEALAGTSRADEAIAFVRDLDQNPAAPMRAYLNGYDPTRILNAAIVASVPMYLAAHPDATAAQATANLQAQLDWLNNARGGVAGGVDLISPEARQTLQASLPLLGRLATGDRAALDALLRLGGGASTQVSGTAAAVAGVGLAIGLLNFGDALLTNDSTRQLYYGLVSTQNGAAALNWALTAMNRAAGTAAQGSLFLTRLAAGAGGLVSLVDIYMQLQGPLDAGTAVSITADVMGIGATLLLLAGSGAGAPLAAAAGIVYVVGELMSTVIQGNLTAAEQARRRDLAARAGLNLDGLAFLASGGFDARGQQLLTPAELDALAGAVPWLDLTNPTVRNQVSFMAWSYGLDAAQTQAVLSALNANPALQELVAPLLSQTSNAGIVSSQYLAPTGSVGSDRGGLEALLRAAAENTRVAAQRAYGTDSLEAREALAAEDAMRAFIALLTTTGDDPAAQQAAIDALRTANPPR